MLECNNELLRWMYVNGFMFQPWKYRTQESLMTLNSVVYKVLYVVYMLRPWIQTGYFNVLFR